MTLMLLVAHFLAFGVAIMVFVGIVFLHRRNRAAAIIQNSDEDFVEPRVPEAARPGRWLVVRTLESSAVRAALGSTGRFSVSRRVNGWVIVTGPGLPNPGEDVDGCFRFLASASRKLGHLQFFHMEKTSGQHAWARMDGGRVTRAYAWAGETLWNQGAPTPAERGLRMKCHPYGEQAFDAAWMTNKEAADNIRKIPLLAARWSLDPEAVRRASSAPGGASTFY